MTKTPFLKVIFPLSCIFPPVCSAHSPSATPEGSWQISASHTWPKTWKGRRISMISTPQRAHPYSPNTVWKCLWYQGLEQIENSDSQNADDVGGTQEGAVSDFSFALLTECPLAVEEGERAAHCGGLCPCRSALGAWRTGRNIVTGADISVIPCLLWER